MSNLFALPAELEPKADAAQYHEDHKYDAALELGKGVARYAAAGATLGLSEVGIAVVGGAMSGGVVGAAKALPGALFDLGVTGAAFTAARAVHSVTGDSVTAKLLGVQDTLHKEPLVAAGAIGAIGAAALSGGGALPFLAASLGAGGKVAAASTKAASEASSTAKPESSSGAKQRAPKSRRGIWLLAAVGAAAAVL